MFFTNWTVMTFLTLMNGWTENVHIGFGFDFSIVRDEHSKLKYANIYLFYSLHQCNGFSCARWTKYQVRCRFVLARQNVLHSRLLLRIGLQISVVYPAAINKSCHDNLHMYYHMELSYGRGL